LASGAGGGLLMEIIMRKSNVNRLTKRIHDWVEEAKNNTRGYSDKQVWRIDKILKERWDIFDDLIRDERLTLEMQGDRYRLATMNTQQLINNN
jgi:hypothetical protein